MAPPKPVVSKSVLQASDSGFDLLNGGWDDPGAQTTLLQEPYGFFEEDPDGFFETESLGFFDDFEAESRGSLLADEVDQNWAPPVVEPPQSLPPARFVGRGGRWPLIAAVGALVLVIGALQLVGVGPDLTGTDDESGSVVAGPASSTTSILSGPGADEAPNGFANLENDALLEIQPDGTAAQTTTGPDANSDTQVAAPATEAAETTAADADSNQVDTQPATSTPAGAAATTAGQRTTQSQTTATTRAPTTATTRGTTATTSRQTTATTRATTSTTQATTSTTRATTSTTRATTTSQATTTTTQPTTTTTRATTTTTQPTTTTTRATTTTTTQPTTTAGGGGNPGREIWRDDFNSLDTSRWRLEHSSYGDSNNELQCYRPENVRVSNGRLVLRAVNERYSCPGGSTRNQTSGMVRSRGVSFSPGQAIEFRVKLNPGNSNDQGGLWPAVWSSSFGPGGWPAGGELDYLEVMTAEDPRRAMFSMHYRNSAGRHELKNRGVIGGGNFSDNWHTIRFDYGRNGVLKWYLDGQLGFEVDYADTHVGYPAPFDRTINEIKINMALGGNPGPLAGGALANGGATFEVDWIRVFEL